MDNERKEFSPEQIRAAKRANRALKELADSGLFLLCHYSSGTIYALHEEEYTSGDTSNSLDCGKIHDGGDF